MIALGLAGGAAQLLAPARTGSALTAADTSTPVPVGVSDRPPPGRRLSASGVLRIAAALPSMRHLRVSSPGSYPGAYLKGRTRWQVSYFSRVGRRELGQVLIDDRSAGVLEQWTGPQVAWTMARGYPGAFAGRADALWVWIPLSLLFVLPFVDPRHPWRLLHLDLLVLSMFSVSLAFFNHADLPASVPLAYPPLLYLLVRMLMLGRRRRRGAGQGGSPAPALRLLVPVPWLAAAVVVLVGFRIGLNVLDSGVVDVGYAGVIGAHRVVHGEPLYGHWPADNQRGDTYGPVSYEAYVPFVALFGWNGRWSDLPAAHAAAVIFDLLALALLYLLGRRVRGPTLGVALAYAWASYPFTLFALDSNSNDALVAVLVLGALLAAASPRGRGALAALGALAKFAPLALVPLLATHGSSQASARARARSVASFALAFAVVGAVVSIPALTHSSLSTIWSRTFVYQANRGSPFSVWGLYGGLHAEQLAVEVAAVLLALAVALIPRREDLVGLAASAGAVLIALQLGIDHWFYLYIPWFFPLVMLALLGAQGGPAVKRDGPSAAPRSSRLAAA